ncbi:MAG TPA: FecR domain-containing protein [Candidatus Saccharicenans sp.]|jgi:hypothetical protein|nr:FecR domain-containing protein [Candidatus Saccharicenans sp.]HRD01751.1 FecR domain-containing protein [Candidatus Saccharicenans sp.]
MRRNKLIILASIILLISLPTFLKAQNEDAQPVEETQYTNESIGRVSFIEGKSFIQRAAEVGYDEVVLNDPVAEGDRIETADGRLEISFGQRNYLRLNGETKIDVLSLPKRASDLTRFRIWSGHAYIEVNRLDKEKNIEIHTPDSSFYILEKGIYRLDVDGNKGTEIRVFKGVAEAAGEQDSYLVKSEQRLEMAQGRFMSKPAGFRPVADDGFDRWQESRSREVNKYYASRYLPEDLRDLEAELSQYGDWVYIAPYGNVWVPRNLGDDWRPYCNGHWTWIPLTGWTWVPYEPWGWAAFHYGRWHWAVGVGWYWIPTSIWGPAWVSWWWDDFYFGWAPLSWYGYPVVVVNGVFYDHYHGYYPVHSRALVMVRRDQLRTRQVARVTLRPENLKGANLENKIMLNTTRLPFRPDGSKVNVERFSGNKVLLRQDSQSSRLSQVKSDSLRGASTGAATNIRKTDSGQGKGTVKPETLKPAKSSSEGKSGSSTTTAPAGKVTPKKIKKKESSPMSSLSGSQPSAVSRNIPTYPSSPKISRQNINRNEYSAASRSYSTPLRSYSNKTYSSGSINSGSRSSTIRKQTGASGLKSSAPRVSRSSISGSGSRSSSVSRAPSSASRPSSSTVHRKK